MVDFLGIEMTTVALALATVFIMGLAPVAARALSGRLRAELARDIQACRDNPANMFIPTSPPSHLLKPMHWILYGFWLIANFILWRHMGVAAWPYAGFLFALLVLTLTDLDVQLLPGQFVGAVLWSGILASLFQLVDMRLADAILGVVVGWALFSIPNWLLSATRAGDDPAVGQGDITLLAACGAWLGPQHVIFAAGIAVAGAWVVRLCIARFVQTAPARLPFGPLIALATVGVLSIYLL